MFFGPPPGWGPSLLGFDAEPFVTTCPADTLLRQRVEERVGMDAFWIRCRASSRSLVERIMAALTNCRRPRGGSIHGSQIRDAFRRLLAESPFSGGTTFGNPLCVITPGGRSPLVREFAEWAAACGRPVLARSGRELGREIATAVAADSWDRLRQRFVAATVVVVEHLETLGSRRRLTAFRHLFDAATAGGTRFCISLASHPLGGPFDPDLAGRLAGGLILPLVNDEPVESDPLILSDDDHSRATMLTKQPPPSLARVFVVTARHYGLTVESLVGPGRSRTVSHARSLAMYLARRLTPHSFAAIGAACGGRDHTTALHGSRVALARMTTDPVLTADAAEILAALMESPRRRGQLG
jgi:hypothetical protein